MRRLFIAAASLAAFAATASAAPTANTCVASKIDCAAKRAAAVLKCYAKAQKKGVVVASDCLNKAQEKFDGCFAKAELKQDAAKPATVCRTEGDAAAVLATVDALTSESACGADPAGCPSGDCEHSPCAVGTALSECNACVARICGTDTLESCCTTAWDARCVAAADPLCGLSCSTYSQAPSKCTGGKTNCTAKRLRALLSCFKAAQKNGTDLDAACIAKAAASFDGGADPAQGCFEKLEAKQDPAKPASLCAITDDTAQAESYSDYTADRLACELDGDHCPCCEGQCFEQGSAVAPPSHYAATDLVCGEATRARTNFMPPCEACGDCNLDEACVSGECEHLAGEPRCQTPRPVPDCVASFECSFMEVAQTEPGTGAGTRGNYRYTFVDVEGYQDRAVYVPMNFDSVAESPTYIPHFFSCEGNGTFMTSRSNNVGCNALVGAPCYDRDGRIFDRAALDSMLTFNMTPQCTGLFYDGPVNQLVSSQFIAERYMLKFTPNPGWTGTARVAVAVQPVIPATFVPVVEYNIHVRPGTPPYEQDGRHIVTRPETGHVYELIVERETWADALSTAVTMNYEGRQGHLLTISDAAENDFVLNHFAGNLQPLYIALGDPISEGAHQWFGVLEPLSYLNWNAGEPNNAGEEDAVAMTTGYSSNAGKWNDVDANSLLRYVVEYE